jgi:hypothetical protein
MNAQFDTTPRRRVRGAAPIVAASRLVACFLGLTAFGCDRPSAPDVPAPTSSASRGASSTSASIASSAETREAARATSEPVVDHARAVEAAQHTMADCKLHFWQECYEGLTKARAFDPAITLGPPYDAIYQDAVFEFLHSKAPDPVEVANRKRLGRPEPRD